MDLVIHVWELDPKTGARTTSKPTVTHVFRGDSRDECEDILEAHLGTDEFLSGAMTTGEWQGIGLEWKGVLVDNARREYAWMG